jgi:hypothetical protein
MAGEHQGIDSAAARLLVERGQGAPSPRIRTLLKVNHIITAASHEVIDDEPRLEGTIVIVDVGDHDGKVSVSTRLLWVTALMEEMKRRFEGVDPPVEGDSVLMEEIDELIIAPHLFPMKCHSAPF